MTASGRTRRAADLSRPTFLLDLRAISLMEGVRAGIAVALTIAAGSLFDIPRLGLAALGALLTCFADPGGPIARRTPAVLSFAVLGTAAFTLAPLLRGLGPDFAAPLGGVAIFCVILARIYGQIGQQVGNLLSVVIVIGLDRALPFGDALDAGVTFLGGAAWAAFLTLVLWRLNQYGPSRRAVGAVARRLADFTRELALLSDEKESTVAFEYHARAHRRAVREAIEAARGIIADTGRKRGAVSARLARTSLRLEALDNAFGRLIALSELLEANPEARAGSLRALRRVGAWLSGFAVLVETQRDPDLTRYGASLPRIAADAARLPEGGAERHALEGLAERLRMLVSLANPDGAPLIPGAVSRSWPDRVLAPLRANLSMGSVPFRHALRVGIAATPALAFAMGIGDTRAHWLTITLIVTMQPYFAATWMRALERVGGTLIGAVIAGAFGYLCTTKLSLAMAMLPLTMFTFAIRSVSFTLFVAAITPMVVLLIEQTTPGTNEIALAGARILYTLAGGVLAIVANATILRESERGRLQQAIADAVASHAAYLDAVFAYTLEGKPLAETVRRAAGLSTNNLEAALSRALLEPHRRADPTLQRASVIDAALRRMSGRLAVLTLNRPAIAEEERALWPAWRGYLAGMMRAGGAQGGQSGPGGQSEPKPPAGPAGEALIRLARQAEVVAGKAGS